MTIKDPRISKPHPHRSGHRCEIKTITGWKHGPTRPTEDEAIAAADEKLAALGAEQASDGAVPLDPNLDPAQGYPRYREAVVGEDTAQPPPQPEVSDEPHRGVPEGIRILGPYPEAGGFRCKVIVGGVQKSAPMDRSKTEALRLAKQLATTLAKDGAITIADALDAFLAHKRRTGIRKVTLDGLRDAVEAYCRGILESSVSRLTAKTGQQLYDRLQVSTAVATHRAYLSRTKSWARWVVTKGWLRSSPLESIQGVGRRRRGKVQLTVDQGRMLIVTCTELASHGDEGAVATLMAICMALRVSEILSRRVEDIDNDGTFLRICDHDSLAFQTKTDDSARSLEIPPGLRPILAQLASGKSPSDPLFPGRGGTGRRSRQWLNDEVTRMCKLASVPVVCPHSLRGAHTTAAVARGVQIDLISDYVGHSNQRMTENHYIAPGVLQAAQLRRGMDVLTKRPEPAPLPS